MTLDLTKSRVLSLEMRLGILKRMLPEDGMPAPSIESIEAARLIFTDLILVHGIAKPAIYPHYEGGIQAEWTLKSWIVDVVFLKDGTKITGGASGLIEDDSEREIALNVDENTVDKLAAWLLEML